MAPHSSTLPWKIPWAEEPGRLQSIGSLRIGHGWATSLSLSLSCIGEGKGNPLQCSCLENPRDGGACWAAIYGVTQSRTRLKWLSSIYIYIYIYIWSWWHRTPVLLPGKSHGRRSLVGCSPCGPEQMDRTEWHPFHFSLSCIGEGNRNPLQCSCLENPGTEEPGGLPSKGSHRVGHNWSVWHKWMENW